MVLVELLAFPVTARSILIPSSMITGRLLSGRDFD